MNELRHRRVWWTVLLRSPLALRDDLASSGRGRCNARASEVSASSQLSTSAEDVRMTGIAFGWIGATTALASLVQQCSPLIGALFGPRTPRQWVHRPRRRKAAHPRSTQTMSAFCAASYRRIRKTRFPGPCSGFAANPSSPMRTAHVADVRNRLAAILRSTRDPPAHHHESRAPAGTVHQTHEPPHEASV
jgi:hypothetical protein